MKLLRTEEILQYDKTLPRYCWKTIYEMNIYRGYRCMQCGEIITEECDMVGHKCKNDASDWEEIEVKQCGQDIEELTGVE